ncbi:MAG: hypothetical protein N0C88_17940 [Candidatus Thiodiazotropha lotti]|nr:hypothetical protein [Candidatus Thiodiazotropha lotti]
MSVGDRPVSFDGIPASGHSGYLTLQTLLDPTGGNKGTLSSRVD